LIFEFDRIIIALLNTQINIFPEHKGVVIDKGHYKHIMALTINPTNHNEGLVRAIVSREGRVDEKGHKNKSEIVRVRSTSGLDKFELNESLKILGEEELIQKLLDADHEFIGFEDPDLVFDKLTKRLHLYFTIPLLRKREDVENIILLGHAEGTSLDDLRMTEPVINSSHGNFRAKEVSFVPVNSNGVRLNLIESNDHLEDGERLVSYSVVRVAEASGYGPPWKLGQIVFHPKFDGKAWCAGHASPGPFMSRDFIDLGPNRLVGFLNGREANIMNGGRTVYGTFSVGLFIYDFELGKVEWVSEKPIIVDSEATTITFASQFIQNGNNGTLYAHVDDSFVRAYSIESKKVKSLIP
jgi:hypothetical protein